ncbi:hypothetical protein [Xylanibacillus composti]|uniref:Uncharacterized protein n=1 Tax=Xylanibacillus composti TaxID=1572762 RepID=A0A8J4M251_9BACL|nr:hypothetical protein [Xylanibacillus composti]GIQ68151.1 hypothetical protein XYCOK13_09750 [Xylanibacillus composti]
MRLWLADHIPSGATFVCAALSLFVPWLIVKIFAALHRRADPPWKKT